MTVVKRNRESSAKDLIQALRSFIEMLEDDDADAKARLKSCITQLEQASDPQSSRPIAREVVDTFEGDMELDCYILKKPSSEGWSFEDERSQLASRVLSLAKRLVH
jgi:hypothetical protein